jgi:hypothetical protein
MREDDLSIHPIHRLCESCDFPLVSVVDVVQGRCPACRGVRCGAYREYDSTGTGCTLPMGHTGYHQVASSCGLPLDSQRTP